METDLSLLMSSRCDMTAFNKYARSDISLVTKSRSIAETRIDIHSMFFERLACFHDALR